MDEKETLLIVDDDEGLSRSLAFINGFSLLDVLMAIVVVTIVATMAIPAVSGILASYDLDAAAQELAAEMGAARTLAVSRGSSYTMTFNVSDKVYQVVDVSDSSNPTRVARTLDGDVIFLAVPSTAIQFSPRGMTRGGTVVLSDGLDARRWSWMRLVKPASPMS